MDNKSKLQFSESIKRNSEELPAELVELSDEDLQQIVGGVPLWQAITGAVENKWSAIKTTTVDLFTQGKLPTGQTATNLIEPLPFSIFRRLFW